MRAALLLALAVLLACANPAQAGWRIDRAKAVAFAVWQQAPCGGDIEVLWREPPAVLGGHPAWVSGVTPCAVYFNSLTPTNWTHFCGLMIHEVGHLLGVGHDENPRSRMYGQPKPEAITYDTHNRIIEWKGVDRACYDRGRRVVGLKPGGYGWE